MQPSSHHMRSSLRLKLMWKARYQVELIFQKLKMYILQVIWLALVVSSVCPNRYAYCSSGDQLITNWSSGEDSWNYWWSYSGVSGPAYWGLLNLDWFMCDKGRRQSPIDIETKSLVYDPHLKPLSVDNNLLSGVLMNDGHSLVLNVSTKLFLQLELANREIKMKEQLNDSRINSIKREISEKENLLEDEPSISFVVSEESSPKLSDSSWFFEGLKRGTTKEDATERSALLDDDVAENSPDTFDTMTTLNEEDQPKVVFSGAGLDYPYQLETLYMRFGVDAKSGSEHKINSHSYAGELQLFAYNSLLYKSFYEAISKPNGILSVAILVDILPENPSETNNKNNKLEPTEPLTRLLSRLDSVKHRDSSIVIRDFNISALLSDTSQFVSYEGSLTIPGCYEGVNWLVLNKALYMTQQNINALRSLSADENFSVQSGTLIAGNVRPTQPINDRLVRTNIVPTGNNKSPETCQRLWTKYQYKSEIQQNNS